MQNQRKNRKNHASSWLTFWLSLFVMAQAAFAQNAVEKLGQVSFERAGAQDYCVIAGVKAAQLFGFDFDGRQAMTSEPLAGPNIRWPLTDTAGQPLAAGKYLVIVKLQLFARTTQKWFRLVKSHEHTEARTLEEVEANWPAEEMVELTRLETLLFPDQGSLWVRYAAALRVRWQTDRMVKVNGYDVREPGVDKARLQADAPTALAALRKGLELAAGDCELKRDALRELASVSAVTGDGQTNEWQKQRLALACETPQDKADIWRARAIQEWERAYAITSAHARRGVSDPFHARRIPAAAQRAQFDQHVAEGLRCLAEALALVPGYADALAYQSLLLREKQKTTFAPAERRQYAAEADRLNAAVVARAKPAPQRKTGGQ